MGYRLADDELVLEALKSVLGSQKTLSSQRELRDRVLKELRRTGPGMTTSGPRLRRLAVTSGLARVEISWRETGEKKARVKCPVCGSRLLPMKNETVFGGTVTLGFRCPACPFRTSMKRKEPTRYIFTRKTP